MSNFPYITLNNGEKIPHIGFGVYQVKAGNECCDSTLFALKAGYRLIDTAHRYANEKDVGEAIKKSGIPRNEIFVTSKLWVTEFGEGKTAEAIDKMLKRLGLDYIDLILLHWPFGDYCGAWKDMEKKVKEGKVKSIGLSNFTDKFLDEILKIATIKPCVNQLECHPLFNRLDFKQVCEKEGIKIEAWYPIGHGNKELFEIPIFKKLAEKYKKSVTQIILRWHIQNGIIPLPKSTNPEHIKENLNIFDFELSKEELEEINNIKPQKSFFQLRGGSWEEQGKIYLSAKLED